MLRTRQVVEADQEAYLAPYALRSSSTQGRRHPEPDDTYRPAFARDRDRIVHCGAFRRLEYKTQVVLSGTGDNYRTRLTHSLEVAQIARSAARTLRLNEDLVEALALAHDLGHPPFGHTGEDVLRDVMKDHGGFEHNVQALRIVDLLESPYPGRQGLNLCLETRESFLKHGPPKQGAVGRDFVKRRHPWLEAQLVDLADSLAYHSHDVDDALRFGVVTVKDLEELELWERAGQEAQRRYPQASAEERLRPTIHQTLHLPIMDLVEETGKRLGDANFSSPQDSRDHDIRLVSFSPDMARMQRQMQRFLFARFYRADRVVKDRRSARTTLRELFLHLLEHPHDRADWARQPRQGQESEERLVCDYVAGMTDGFAQREHQRLVQGAR